jgi:hypothetical protein
VCVSALSRSETADSTLTDSSGTSSAGDRAGRNKEDDKDGEAEEEDEDGADGASDAAGGGSSVGEGARFRGNSGRVALTGDDGAGVAVFDAQQNVSRFHRRQLRFSYRRPCSIASAHLENTKAREPKNLVKSVQAGYGGSRTRM